MSSPLLSPEVNCWHRLLASLLDTIILMLDVLPLEWLAGSFGRMQNDSVLNLEVGHDSH